MAIRSEEDQCRMELDELRRELLRMEGEERFFMADYRAGADPYDYFYNARHMMDYTDRMIDNINDVLAFNCKPSANKDLESVVEQMQRIVDNMEDSLTDPVQAVRDLSSLSKRVKDVLKL